jgi:hypothetical protein
MARAGKGLYSRAVRLRILIAVLGICCVLAAVAEAALPPRPKAGHWKFHGGGFTVSHDRKSVSGLHLNLSSSQACHSGDMSVSGKFRLTTTSRAGYTNWIVGHSAPKTSDGYTALRVTVHAGGHTISAQLKMIFAIGGTSSSNEGQLQVGGCFYVFYPTR